MDKVSYSMIIRFFSGECTAEEREAVIRWVNRSDDNALRITASRSSAVHSTGG